MKAIITGATGHIGINLIRELLEQGWEVTALSRHPGKYLEALPVETQYGDIGDQVFLNEAIADADAVFHLAGVLPLQESDARRVWQVNVDGTAAVIEACKHTRRARLIYCSSVHAFEEVDDGILDESTPLIAHSSAPVYDRSKAVAHRYVLDAAADGVDAVVICPTGVIGPYDFKPSSMGGVIQRLISQEMRTLVAGGVNWVDVRDVARSMIHAFERASSGTVFMVGGQYRSVVALARQVCLEADVPLPGFTSPMWLATLAAPFVEAWSKWRKTPPLFTRESLRALHAHPHVSIQKMVEELGVIPRSFEETIHDTVAWHMTLKGSN